MLSLEAVRHPDGHYLWCLDGKLEEGPGHRDEVEAYLEGVAVHMENTKEDMVKFRLASRFSEVEYMLNLALSDFVPLRNQGRRSHTYFSQLSRIRDAGKRVELDRAGRRAVNLKPEQSPVLTVTMKIVEDESIECQIGDEKVVFTLNKLKDASLSPGLKYVAGISMLLRSGLLDQEDEVTIVCPSNYVYQTLSPGGWRRSWKQGKGGNLYGKAGNIIVGGTLIRYAHGLIDAFPGVLRFKLA